MAADADETNKDLPVADGDLKKEEVVESKENGQADAVEPQKSETPLPETDEFGLPIRPARRREVEADDSEEESDPEEKFEDPANVEQEEKEDAQVDDKPATGDEGVTSTEEKDAPPTEATDKPEDPTPVLTDKADEPKPELADKPDEKVESPVETTNGRRSSRSLSLSKAKHGQKPSLGGGAGASEWSHQQLAPQTETDEKEEEEEESWQEMPALATHRIYDDWGKVLAKEYDEVEDETVAYGNLGGAGKGYTRVQVDEDAQSATSMDDNTAYLFKEGAGPANMLDEDDEDERDLNSQLQTTKELLTEGQRIAYVGLVRLTLAKFMDELAALEKSRGARKTVDLSSEATRMWSQKIMVHLYSHMEIDQQEQVMVEQLAEHGVIPSDMTPILMQNARIKNPQAKKNDSKTDDEKKYGEEKDLSSARSSGILSEPEASLSSPQLGSDKAASSPNLSAPDATPDAAPGTPTSEAPPPAYEEQAADDLTVKDASEVMNAKNIDLDLRWTVLCDLFLLLIGDGIYDARSRTLLEWVGAALSVEWQEICRFEKRVTDALEVQEQADKENWNEDKHVETREKMSRNKRLMVMGLCTVGGGLVIGLSAGMLAPVIGAGLAAGFTGVGIAGTGGFLGGTGAAALIGTTGTLVGSSIGMRTSNRRTGAVKTFEYRPLFNNKRVNLIVTVSGWMTGNVDDVRLPFSTVDPIMGDIYSVNWEPEMLQSTGQTIQILGTEALTQTIQQILGATFLATLMAGLSLPLILTKLSYLIDNPWTVSLARADSTGLILADSLIDRNLGTRPITLVGFSLGSRVIFSCLRELARRGAWGMIQNVYIFGSPVVVKRDEWTRARSVVSGRFVNGYATNDWILAYLFRATSGGVMRVAGLATVEIPGIENIDVTSLVPGHMAYRGKMPTLLDLVGWQVESLEFSEIEDPDPESHEKRQRELIREIDEARRELEEKPEKKGFKAFFSRKKAQKKDWQIYDDRNAKIVDGEDPNESEKMAAENSSVMFDVDAIAKEAMQLALQGGDMEEIKGDMQIREIASTMPALKISLDPNHSNPGSPGLKSGRSQSHDGSVNTSSTPAQSSPGMKGTNPSDEEPEDITMTFDTPEKSPQPISPAFINGSTRSVSSSLRPSPVASPDPTKMGAAPESSWSPSSRVFERSRPPMARNAATTGDISTTDVSGIEKPRPANRSPSGRNPWSDEDDEGFGKEKDMEMSFE